ncbi:MAG: hypothetical protein KKF80_04255 [Candidatus Omnitrophica bacterium]|nr:hypothetical protein [Candidatus Omnitrophota bacterium]
MKKIAVILEAKDAHRALGTLRSLGILHVEYLRPPASSQTASLQQDYALLSEAIAILGAPEFKDVSADASTKPYDWKACARRIIDSYKRLDQLNEYLVTMRQRIVEWEPWGDFDPAALVALTQHGIVVKLYQIPRAEIKNIPPAIIVKEICVREKRVHCALINREKVEVPFKEVMPSKMSLAAMRERLNHDQRTIATIRKDIARHTVLRARLQDTRAAIVHELEFQKALVGMGQEGALSYITGYIPFDTVGKLKEASRIHQWALSVSDPGSEDAVPTLIRNPRWVSLIEPIFKLIEVTPGYRELDISIWFLIFFSIFFGMLIGDAGVGLVFMILTAFFQRKAARKGVKTPIFILFHILSLCAIIWGVLTGTFFGQVWLPVWIKPLVPALRNERNVQVLCFFLGATHLTIAHLWRAVLKFPALRAFADVGWIIILWVGFFLAKALVLGDAFPAFGLWFFISGAVLVITCADPQKNILKGLANGFGGFLLSVVNSFTDVVSYIRLFAVGLASVAVADAFMLMALEIGHKNIFSTIAMSVVLIAGQALNVVLGPMAVLVHGVRLNVLEFCGHVDVKWSGFEYKPLAE